MFESIKSLLVGVFLPAIAEVAVDAPSIFTGKYAKGSPTLIGKYSPGLGRFERDTHTYIPLNATKIFVRKKSDTRIITEDSTTACLAAAPTPSAPPLVFNPT